MGSERWLTLAKVGSRFVSAVDADEPFLLGACAFAICGFSYCETAVCPNHPSALFRVPDQLLGSKLVLRIK